MASKIEKLKELGGLLKSGAITKEEFENLKKEILQLSSKKIKNPKLIELEELLNSDAITQEEFESLKLEILNPSNEKSSDSKKAPPPSSSISPSSNFDLNKEKINLESFYDTNNFLNKAPNIKYINFKNILDSEKIELTKFIRLKYTGGYQMTNDEVKLGELFFTPYEILEMGSERPGLNHAFNSIISVIAACGTLYFILLNPCMMFLGGISGVLITLFSSISTLNKVDATKLDKTLCYISLLLVGIAIIIFLNDIK